MHDFNEHDWRKSNNATYAERGRDRLLEILPKNSKIDLAGFKHSACVMQYAMKLSEVYNVRLLEELTDLLCDPRSAVDTGNPENWFYKRLLERGVEFVPHPIQVKLYSLKAINPPVSVPEFWTSEKRGDIFKSCLFLIDKLNIPLENIQYSEQLLYASGLNKPNSVSI